ncbi:MAG: WD40/YVTN/BNR-like repeat-containing protein [Flavobacteriales bacterium]
MSGRISDIEGHPTNSQIVYVGTAGGGVWKSNDAGVNFNPLFDDHCQSIGAVAVDPTDPDNTVWVGTGEVWTRNSVSIGDGIYKTTDGGKSWTHMGLRDSERISAIEVDPRNHDVIYAGVLGALWSDSDSRGVYKSTDGGKTWSNVLSVNKTTGCSELIMDPVNPDVLYAAFWEFRRTSYSFSSGGTNSALYKSTDGGKTWNKIHNGFPQGKLGRIAVAVAPSDPKILYAVIEAESNDQKGLYRSDDAGASWRFLNGDFGLVVRPFYFSRISIDPKNPDIVVKAGLFGSISRDGGKTFKSLGSMHADIHDIWFDPNNSQQMLVATDGGVYRSMNAGAVLQRSEGLPVSQFYHVTVDNQEPYNVYGGLQDNGSWFGPSSSPGGIEARDWEVVGQGDGFRVYPHPSKPEIVYSEMQGAESVWRYNSKTGQIKEVAPTAGLNETKLRFNWNTPIATSRHNPDRLFIGSQYLMVSDDMGDTWKKISPDLTTNDPLKLNQENSGGLSKDNSGAENHCTIFTIAESPKNAKVIWVGTDDGNVQLTRDGGTSWVNVRANIQGLPANTWCYHIEASVFGEETAYAVFEDHTRGNFTPYIYRTTDFGKTWTSVVNGDIPTFVRCVQEDLSNPELLYAGTEMGLYVSNNAGKSWARFKNSFPAVAVHHLEMHPRTLDLVAATHGRGIIILDNTQLLRELNASVMSKGFHFFESKPYLIDESSSFGGTSTEHQFVGANPSKSAQISYFLNKRHTFGKMTMEILDMEDKVITTLQPGKQKGINTVEWGFSTTVPKSAIGKSFSGAAMMSPTAKAGLYKVRITKGSEVFEKQIEVKYDPNSMITQAERDQQHKATMELFDFIEDLAYLVYQVDAWDKKVEEHASSQPKPSKNTQALAAALDGLREKLVVTSGDNYVGAGEPRLREKLNDIYMVIGGYPGAPSSSQLETVQALKKEFQDHQKTWASLQSGELKKFTAELAKANRPPAVIKPKEVFLKES